ncbi:substrate-binding periplasmic protein [Leeia aquatica]|uniref:Amino acid ABC transporter substrate-binding protein n=1 Tax=Leeia aquatica TaxID=2725557 RepID=A0A847SB51_9NEIS|nr:transporter substrate-binding domain-containing protein [Leeia aquatica]NLR76963.1 amino acid ABC transporter substrate-binding protein [Leeia aquatica]
MKSLKQLITLALISTVLQAHAESFNFATGNDYAPFADQKLPEGGMVTEIVKRAFTLAGAEAKFSWLEWDAGFKATQAGKYAGTFPYSQTPERSEAFLFSEPVFVTNLKVFTRTDKTFAVSGGPSVYQGKKACIPKGWAVSPFLQAMLKSGTITRVEAEDITPCAKLLGEGKVDFYVTDEIQGQKAFQAAGLTNKQIVPSKETVASTAMYLLVPKALANAQHVVDTFNKGLKALKLSGEYAKIMKKHIDLAMKS